MNANVRPDSNPAPRPRFPGLAVPGLVAVLTLAALLAVASGAAAQTAESTAYGHRVDLDLLSPRGETTVVESAPTPLAAGAAPLAYDLTEKASSSRVEVPLGLGNLLATGSIEVAARSAMPESDDAAAGADVDAVRLSLGGLLTLAADTVTAVADVLPDDGETCWAGTTSEGGATFANAVLGGGLVPVPIVLPASPEPNYVAFEAPGVLSVILNEQVVGDGRMSVHAVHVRLDNLLVIGVGTLQGDVYIGHADAVVGCGGADVSISIVDAPDPGMIGAQVTYTATVSNAGPERALDTLLGALLPVSVNPLSATPSQGECALAGRTLACSLGDLRAGETATVAVVVTPIHSGAIAVPMEAAAANPDVFTENNHACETTLVHGTATLKNADLRVTLAASADPIEVGQTLTYTLTVRHDGGIAVPAAFATLELPPGMSLLSVTPGQGSCSGDPTVVCNLGKMFAGQQVPVTVTIRVDRGGALMAKAVVSSAVNDPDLTDNVDAEFTQAEDPPA